MMETARNWGGLALAPPRPDKFIYVRRGQKDYFAVDKDAYSSVNSALQAILTAIGIGK